jgi:hypothetical protein
VNEGWYSIQYVEEILVLNAARDYGKLLADPEHDYWAELEAEENLLRAINQLIQVESGK